MLGSRVEVPVVAVSPSALVRFPFLRWLREGARVLIPHRHPLVSRYSWQVLGPREICLCSSGTRALQELSVWGALSLLFLLQKHQRRPKKWCHTQCCAILDCVSLRWLWGYVSTPNGGCFFFVFFKSFWRHFLFLLNDCWQKYLCTSVCVTCGSRSN